MHISAAYAVVRCPSVRPLVTLVHSVERNKRILKICSPSGSHTILVFLYRTLQEYSDGEPPNEGVECRWGTQKIAILDQYLVHCVL